MSSTNRRPINLQSGTTTRPPYFLIIMTNYPDLLQRTREYQPSYWQPQRHPRGMLIPGVRVHFGTVYTDDRERLLYNTLRFQLEQIIRTYLHQTHQLNPIYLVFDMSNYHYKCSLFMEFSTDELDRIMMDLPCQPSVNTHHTNNSSSTTVNKEPSMLNEQEISTRTNENDDRQYCLIIFNNPSWSARLRRKTSSQVEEQQEMAHTINHTESTAVKSEPQDNSVDDLFVAQLRQLINDYMLRTKRPFPVKYFLDFTTN